jgi:hypothetical protein
MLLGVAATPLKFREFRAQIDELAIGETTDEMMGDPVGEIITIGTTENGFCEMIWVCALWIVARDVLW